MSELTPRSEDYLKTIYKLQLESKEVCVKDLARSMGVRAPTVVGALSSLKEGGYVQQKHYGTLSLTEEGRQIAKRLIEREELLVAFFSEVLDLDEEEARKNACSIEHYITPLCLKRFVDFIRVLATCNRGRPRWMDRFSDLVRTGEVSKCDCFPEGTDFFPESCRDCPIVQTRKGQG